MRASRTAFVALVVFSAFVNLLMLTAPLYMLQVFDRVLTSRSTDTLLVLSLIAGVALLTLAALEGVRNFALIKIGSWLDKRLGNPVLRASITGALKRQGNASVQGLRDLATFRSFVGGPSMFPIMDAPWTPLFIAVIFLLNPLLGWMAVAGAIVLFGLAVANELATRSLLQQSGDAQIAAMLQAESAVRNADTIEAMGMLDNLAERWERKNTDALELQARAGNRSGVITSMSKFIRLGLQTAMLGTGAWLVIQNGLTPGGMIAGTILLGRALAPVDQAIGSWKALLAARSAYRRLRGQLQNSAPDDTMTLPPPKGEIECEGLTFGHGEEGEPTVSNIGFKVPAGKALALVGPAAAGKTTLARLLLGILKPRLGHVRLDGMEVSEWRSTDRGRHIGYLPQDIELFAGPIRDNIARMGQADPELVLAAARLAGVHEMILRLPQGYETEVGEGGAALSGGQRQRIALAPALYGNPSVVVLDELNSNLDQSGVEALLNAIIQLKAMGTTLIIIAHQPSVVRHVDYLVVLSEGKVQMSGPRDEMISRVTGPKSTTGPLGEQGESHA